MTPSSRSSKVRVKGGTWSPLDAFVVGWAVDVEEEGGVRGHRLEKQIDTPSSRSKLLPIMSPQEVFAAATLTVSVSVSVSAPAAVISVGVVCPALSSTLSSTSAPSLTSNFVFPDRDGGDVGIGP